MNCFIFPVCLLCQVLCFIYLIQSHCELAIIIPILQMRILRLQEVRLV